jgi:hypothetical protein
MRRWIIRLVLLTSLLLTMALAFLRRRDVAFATDDEPAWPPRPAWVGPSGNGIPDGFPVKVKLSSGIFHVPGGFAYDRTIADRYYASTGGAEADGFRAAKR